LAAARARGRIGGRPKIMDAGKVKLARTLMADNSRCVGEICEILGVSKATLYRYLKD